MSWLGIPFPFLEPTTTQLGLYQITKLPELVIKTGFSWESIIGALIAGSIPAVIAWKTIKNNNDLIRQQMFMASQQKKCDELKELFANYISLQSVLIDYTEMIYDAHGGDRAKIPLEIKTQIKEDFARVERCVAMIYLMMERTNEHYSLIRSKIKELEEKVLNHFNDYVKRNAEGDFSLENEFTELLDIFSKYLTHEQEKI